MEEEYRDIDHKHLKSLDRIRKKLFNKRKETVWVFVLIPIVLLFSMILFSEVMPVFILTGFAALVSGLIYDSDRSDFERLQSDLLKRYLTWYRLNRYPNENFQYSKKGKKGKSIFNAQGIYKYQNVSEEDAIWGEIDGVPIYFSEVKIKQDSEEERLLFRGMMFHINFEDINFPKTKIYSKSDPISSIFSGMTKHPEYGIYYKTKDKESFGSRFANLIKLLNPSANMRIYADGNNLTILMEQDRDALNISRSELGNKEINAKNYEHLSAEIHSYFLVIEELIRIVMEQEETLDLDKNPASPSKIKEKVKNQMRRN